MSEPAASTPGQLTVVVGYVPRPEGRAALDAGIEQARSRGARLVVVNASRGDSLVDQRYLQGAARDELKTELDGLDVPAELYQPPSGSDVAEQIADLVARDGVELVVIGLRRRSAVGKLIMGSAAQRILLEVDCPVLCVKA